MNSAFGRVILGQVLLVVCCIFYLIWWRISYRPGVSVNRERIVPLITEGVSMTTLLIMTMGYVR